MNRDELVERMAETLWQTDYLRATGRFRLVPWSEAGEQPHKQWRSIARAALAVAEPAIREACLTAVYTRQPLGPTIDRAETIAAIRAGGPEHG